MLVNILPIVWEIIFYTFCGVIAIQIFYYLFFFTRLAFYKKKEKTVSMQHPVSIIVCAKDEAHNLAKNLPGILVQDYKTTHEIVVVNDNSTDDTRYLLEEFQKSFKNLNQIELSQEAKLIEGKKFPLSIGIKSAKHEILLLTDADCVPASENWLYKMQNAYDENIAVVIGYGAYRKSKGILNKLIRFETFHTALQYFSYALAGIPYMGVGRNLSYKRDLFFKHKGFSSINTIPSGDDDLFINKPLHKFLLGLYSFSLFCIYPLLAISIIFYCWWLALAVFGVRFLLQGFIYFKTMKKLNEKDLWIWYLLFDLWMPLYYLFTIPAILKSPKRTWA